MNLSYTIIALNLKVGLLRDCAAEFKKQSYINEHGASSSHYNHRHGAKKAEQSVVLHKRQSAVVCRD